MTRERAPDKQPIPVGEARSLEDKQVLKQMPAAYLNALADNPKLKPCCRDVTKNYTYQTFKTDEAMEKPNMAIFTCTTCGCKHYRGAVGPGKL